MLLLQHKRCIHDASFVWKDNIFFLSLKGNRETCAIWINACYDNSGSSDLKCAVIMFLWNCPWALYLVGSFIVIGEPFLRVGYGERRGLKGRELCNCKVFTKWSYSVFYNWLMSVFSLKKHLSLPIRHTLILPPYVINKLPFPVTRSPGKLRL